MYCTLLKLSTQTPRLNLHTNDSFDSEICDGDRAPLTSHRYLGEDDLFKNINLPGKGNILECSSSDSLDISVKC